MPVSKKRKKKKKKKTTSMVHNPYLEARERVTKKLEKSPYSQKIKYEQFEDSVSGLILEFGKDYIDQCLNKQDYHIIIPIIIICWNVSNFEEEERPALLEKFSEELDLSAFENDIQILIDRKIKKYSQYRYFVVQYDISFPNDDLHLEVASTKM